MLKRQDNYKGTTWKMLKLKLQEEEDHPAASSHLAACSLIMKLQKQLQC